MNPTTTICTDHVYDYPLADARTKQLTPYTEVTIYRCYGSFETQDLHTRVWTMRLPYSICNQSRAEAIGRRRPSFCRVIHLP